MMVCDTALTHAHTCTQSNTKITFSPMRISFGSGARKRSKEEEQGRGARKRSKEEEQGRAIPVYLETPTQTGVLTITTHHKPLCAVIEMKKKMLHPKHPLVYGLASQSKKYKADYHGAHVHQPGRGSTLSNVEVTDCGSCGYSNQNAIYFFRAMHRLFEVTSSQVYLRIGQLENQGTWNRICI